MKIYSTSYSQYYQNIAKAFPPLSVPSGMMTCFAIPFPSEGFLEAVVINQVSTDTTRSSATVELLNSRLPYPPGNYAINAAPADALQHYRILPTPIAIGINSVGMMDEDYFGLSFRNIDGGWTTNQRFIYVLINPGGTAAITNWNLTLRCRTDIG